jgi:hypothetical protein
MIFIYYKDSKTLKTKNRQVWRAGWSDTAYGCSKSRNHAAAAEAGGPSWYDFVCDSRAVSFMYTPYKEHI